MLSAISNQTPLQRESLQQIWSSYISWGRKLQQLPVINWQIASAPKSLTLQFAKTKFRKFEQNTTAIQQTLIVMFNQLRATGKLKKSGHNMAEKPEGIPKWEVVQTDRFLHYVGNYICQPAWNTAPKDGHLATHSSQNVKSHVERKATTWMTLRGPDYLLAELRNNLRSCCRHGVVAATHTSDGQPASHPFDRHLLC